jgi:hypothetical protein
VVEVFESGGAGDFGVDPTLRAVRSGSSDRWLGSRELVEEISIGGLGSVAERGVIRGFA